MPKLDLVNWTMRAAKQLRPEHHMRGDIEGPPSVCNILLGVLEGERGEPTSEGSASVRSVQLAGVNPIASPPSAPAEGRKPDTTSNLPADTQSAPLAPAGQASPMSPLLKAIVEPDIYTAPADRERAIVLRWVLRDIKANRLKLSPVDQLDLRDLIEMGLVEMRGDVPLLTNAGDNAII